MRTYKLSKLQVTSGFVESNLFGVLQVESIVVGFLDRLLLLLTLRNDLSGKSVKIWKDRFNKFNLQKLWREYRSTEVAFVVLTQQPQV